MCLTCVKVVVKSDFVLYLCDFYALVQKKACCEKNSISGLRVSGMTVLGPSGVRVIRVIRVISGN